MRRTLAVLFLAVIALPLFATEPNPSKRQRELIDKLLDSMNMGKTGQAMMDAVFGQIEKQFLDNAAIKGNDPDDVAEAKEMFASFRKHSAAIDVAGTLYEAQVRIYAKYFTEAELADLAAFYATPTGQKTIEVMPHLMSEGMEAGASELGPKIEAVMKEVTEEQEKKRPWRRTMSDIRNVATAIEAYAVDNDDTYPTGDYAALKELLSPTYIVKFPEKDIWGHEYAYVASSDGLHYRLVSGGADSNFEWDSRRIAEAAKGADEEESPDVRYRDRLEDDFIYADGSFLQLPVQAKPKPQN